MHSTLCEPAEVPVLIFFSAPGGSFHALLSNRCYVFHIQIGPLLILNVLHPCHSPWYFWSVGMRYGDEQGTVHYVGVFYAVICLFVFFWASCIVFVLVFSCRCCVFKMKVLGLCLLEILSDCTTVCRRSAHAWSETLTKLMRCASATTSFKVWAKPYT